MIEKVDSILDVGIYSLCHTNNLDDGALLLYAGTKRGSIISVPIQNGTRIAGSMIKTITTNSSFPIYSMTWKNGILACGGGDRYVTLYHNTTSTNLSELHRLGPHTGWVKDACFHSNNNNDCLLLLFSLGCNCIETWKYYNHKNDHGWSHESTIRMNSCPTNGTTLSSDLLCAFIYQKYLLVGGVDGRIHLLDTSTSNIISSIPAHDGRVNQLLILSQKNMICSIGHDGTFQCRRIIITTNNDDDDIMISQTPDIQYEWKDERLLTMAEIISSNDDNKVAIGTASGSVILFSPTTSSASLLSTFDQTTIHSLCHIPSTNILAIGHSNGLSVLYL